MVSSYRLAMHSTQGLNASLIIFLIPSESSLINYYISIGRLSQSCYIKIDHEFNYVTKVYWQNILLYVLTHLANQLVAANLTWFLPM